MITIEAVVPTQGDLKSVEEVREHWCELHSKVRDVMNFSDELHQHIEDMRESFSGAVALFEKAEGSRKAELKREMAAMRCQFRRAKLAAKINDMEDAIERLSSELAEFKVRDQMRGILDKCAD